VSFCLPSFLWRLPAASRWLGATLAFLGSRFLLRDAVKAYFSNALAIVDEGMRKDEIAYLLTLRLLPIFPFFLTNIVMGVTSVRTRTFYVVSQIGMLAATLLYVNAGTQLAHVQKMSGILSRSLIAALLLLSLFPGIAKLAVGLCLLQREKRGRVWGARARPLNTQEFLKLRAGTS